MDFFYVSLLSFLVILASFSLGVVLFKSKHAADTKLPPGRAGWPLIGESLDFLATGRKGHPEKFISDRMSKYSSKLFKTSLFLEDTIVFCGSAGNKFLFSNESKLLEAWWPSSVDKIFPSNQITSIDSNKLRKFLPNFLKPEALQRYLPVMDLIARKHFATEWDNNEEVMTYKLAKKFTFSLACKIFLSVDDPEQIKSLSSPIEQIVCGILSIPIDLPGTPFRRGIKAANCIRKELMAIANKRKIDLAQGIASPTQDILSLMLLYSDEEGKFMTESEIADKILSLLIGGHDTASSTCASIVKYLAELPEVYDRVYKEQTEIANSKAEGELLNWEDLSKMKYSWNVVCEVLRLVPPLQGTFRNATIDFMYNGYSIPKGWKLYWSAHSTHKNPEFFPEPQKFDPLRFDGNGPAPYSFVPFGGGPRMCPGKEYARLEILVFLYHLVRKFKWEKIIPDEQILVNPLPRPAKGLPIRLYPHKAKR